MLPSVLMLLDFAAGPGAAPPAPPAVIEVPGHGGTWCETVSSLGTARIEKSASIIGVAVTEAERVK